MRTAFVAQLAEAEHELERALREVPPALALAAAAERPVADLLVAEALRLRTRCRSADATLVTIAACQAPVAGDLRLLLALLQVSRHAMLIANQLRMIGG